MRELNICIEGRKAIPVNLPLVLGSTSPTALAAPETNGCGLNQEISRENLRVVGLTLFTYKYIYIYATPIDSMLACQTDSTRDGKS